MIRTRSLLFLPLIVLLMVVTSCKNRPPELAQPPEGPVSCYPNKLYTYAVTPTDPNNDNVAARCDWGDDSISEWSEWSPSGAEITLSHAWVDTGTFEVKAQAQDKKQLSSEWSAPLAVQVLPRPETPAVPKGPALCFKDTSYSFRSTTTDRFGDSISIRFDWGKDTSSWSPFVASGETVALSYAWTKVGSQQVTAQARDPKNHLTDWSAALAVEVVLRAGPNTPYAPDGPVRGGAGADSVYQFTARATHPQDLLVAIRFAWGDGDTSDWSQYMAPNEPVTGNHAWLTPDTFEVRAQAKDTGGALSGWSDPHIITIRPADTMRLWRFPIKTGVAEANISSPAIGPDGTIYVGSQDDYLYAVKPDGSLKWSFQTGGVVRGSPAVRADGTVYVGSYDNRLYCIDPTNGTAKWSYMTGGNIPSSPAIAADGTIIFGSSDKKIYALNPDSTLKWSYLTGSEVYSSPAIGPDGTIYCGSNDDYLYALTPDGGLKWRFPTDRDIDGSPAIGADGTVYFGSLDGYLRAVDSNGTLMWSVLTNGQIHSSPAIGPDGTIYVGSDDNILYAVNPDGSTKWRYVTGDNVASSPAISANGTILFGSDDNNLYGIGSDSVAVFMYPTDYDIESSPTIGADGKIYFVGFDGYLYQLKGTSPLAGTAWPKFRHDTRNGGRSGGK